MLGVKLVLLGAVWVWKEIATLRVIPMATASDCDPQEWLLDGQCLEEWARGLRVAPSQQIRQDRPDIL